MNELSVRDFERLARFRAAYSLGAQWQSPYRGTDWRTASRLLYVRWLVRSGKLHEGEHWMTLDPRTARLSRSLESCS